MITYVNTVFVSNNTSDSLLSDLSGITTAAGAASNKGRFLVYDVDNNAYAISANTTRFKIGMITGKVSKDHKGTIHPEIKWSNIIIVRDIKSIATLSYTADTEDTAYLNFRGLDAAVLGKLDDGGKRVIVRLTYKDMPHRYRKWTESYEYVTKEGDTANSIVQGIVEIINKEWKRARVVASLATASAGSNPGDADTFTDTASGSENSANAVKIVALPYDDDDSVDSLSWANKVRFNVNMYWTDPAGEGWESLNKNFPKGVQITKIPGEQYAASAKLVRDRESQGMGYEGILNRGDGTWPIIKPAMETKLDGQYNALTLEFENMYRAADDIFRKTKQAVEIYVDSNSSVLSAIASAIATAQAGAGVASANAAVDALDDRIDAIVSANTLTEPTV